MGAEKKLGKIMEGGEGSSYRGCHVEPLQPLIDEQEQQQGELAGGDRVR
jgi:hypothetical protein